MGFFLLMVSVNGVYTSLLVHDAGHDVFHAVHQALHGGDADLGAEQPVGGGGRAATLNVADDRYAGVELRNGFLYFRAATWVALPSSSPSATMTINEVLERFQPFCSVSITMSTLIWVSGIITISAPPPMAHGMAM